MSPVRAPLRSSSALVAVVVPWTITPTSAAPTAASARAPCTPPAWFATVVGTLATRTRPVSSSTSTRSVNVPPTSTPTSLVWGIYPRGERGQSGDMGHGSRRWDEREPSRRAGPCQARRLGLPLARVRPGREHAGEVAVQVMMEGLLLRRHAPRSVRGRGHGALHGLDHRAILLEDLELILVVDLQRLAKAGPIEERLRKELVDDGARAARAVGPAHHEAHAVDAAEQRAVGGEEPRAGEADRPVLEPRHLPQQGLGPGRRGSGRVEDGDPPARLEMHVVVRPAEPGPEGLRVQHADVIEVHKVLEPDLPVAVEVEHDPIAEPAVLHPQEREVLLELGDELVERRGGAGGS